MSEDSPCRGGPAPASRLVHACHQRVDVLLTVAGLAALDEVGALLGHAALPVVELDRPAGHSRGD